MPQVFYTSPFQALSSSGAPLPGAKLYFFKTDTTTAAEVYADAARTSTLPNPVISDSQGRFPQLYARREQLYRVRLTDSANVQQWENDGVSIQLFPRTDAEATTAVKNFSYEPGDVRRYGVTGTDNDTETFQRAIDNSKGLRIVIPEGVTVSSTNVTISESNTCLEIRGTLKAPTSAPGNDLLIVTGDFVTVIGPGRLDVNGANTGIRNTGKHFVARGVVFRGNCANYIDSTGDYCGAEYCRVEPGYNQKGPPLLFRGYNIFDDKGVFLRTVLIESPFVIGCELNDVRGFNIQFRYARRPQAIGNRIKNPIYSDGTATTQQNGQSLFTINLTVADIDRVAVVVNGKQRKIKPFDENTEFQNNHDGTYTVQLDSPAFPGDNIVFHGCRSLENIQFNSQCEGGLALGNICDGTGDSNIVIGADHHQSDLPNPKQVVESDYPSHIVVKDNILRTAFASSVNMSQCHGGLVGGNDCSGFAIRYDNADGPFYCAIFCGGGNGTGTQGRFHVQANTISGDNTRTTYGVGGWETTDSVGSQAIDFRRRPTKKSFDRQNFVGPVTAHYFISPHTVSIERKFDVTAGGSEWIEYPSPLQELLDAPQSIVGIPNSNDYWGNQVTTGPQPVTRDTSIKIGGTASAQVGGGKEWQAQPKAFKLFASSLLKISFWARNDGTGQGRVEVFYDHGSDDATPQILMVVQSTEWEQYELVLPVTTIDNFFFRVVGGSSTGTHFQYLRIQYLPLNIN